MKKLLSLPVLAAFVVPSTAAADTADIPGYVYMCKGRIDISKSEADPVQYADVYLYKRTAAGG